MSDGVDLYDPSLPSFFSPQNGASLPKGYWNYNEKIKFYMQVAEEITGNVEFALTASLREKDGAVNPQRMTIYANNRRIGEWLWDRLGSEEKTVQIPQEILEESRGDVMRLLTLMFYLNGEDATLDFNIMLEKMEFRRES